MEFYGFIPCSSWSVLFKVPQGMKNSNSIRKYLFVMSLDLHLQVNDIRETESMLYFLFLTANFNLSYSFNNKINYKEMLDMAIV